MKRKRIVKVFFASMLFLLPACLAGIMLHRGSSAVHGTYKRISPEEAQKIMKKEKDFILLDVRMEDEFKEERIQGAVLIPDYEIKKRAEEELPRKDATILVYCRSGRRSAAAAKELAAMGYTNVLDFGGILDWPYETVNG